LFKRLGNESRSFASLRMTREGKLGISSGGLRGGGQS
jgi:hypothetical protein